MPTKQIVCTHAIIHHLCRHSPFPSFLTISHLTLTLESESSPMKLLFHSITFFFHDSQYVNLVQAHRYSSNYNSVPGLLDSHVCCWAWAGVCQWRRVVSAEWVRVTILIVCCGVYGRAAGLLIDFVTPYLMKAWHMPLWYHLGKKLLNSEGWVLITIIYMYQYKLHNC